MTALRNMRMLARYAAWANRLLFQTLSSLPENELTKMRHIVFGNILRTLNHVYVMDLVWQAHLEGRSHGFTTRNPETHPAFAELRAAQKQIDEWYISYHRGHIADMIYQIPASPPTTDLPVFLRDDPLALP